MAKKMYTREELHTAESNARLTQIARSATMMQGYVNRIAELEAENVALKSERNTVHVDSSAVLKDVSPLLDQAREKLEMSQTRIAALEAENAELRKPKPDMVDVVTFDGKHARVKIENPSNGVYDKYWQAGSNVIWRLEWCPRCLYTVTVDAVDLPDYELDWNILLNEAMIHICVQPETVTHRMVGAGHGLLGGFDYTFYCPDCFESLCYDVGIADTYGNTKEFRDMLYEAFNHTHEDD